MSHTLVWSEDILAVKVASPVISKYAVCFVAHARAYTQNISHTCVEMTRWAAQPWFPSGWEQQCSVDPFRQNSPVLPHQKVSQIVPAQQKKSKKEIIKRNRWRWSLRATVKQKSAGQWRTELCSPYQYHSGCGAHHPASTTAIPEIKIMSGLRLWLHPGESSGEREDCHVFPRWDCSFHEIRPSRTRIQTACTHTHPPQRCGRQSSVGDIWNHTHRHTH